MKFSNNKISSAFTLAEVLITLGIIGIIAAITIPTLMNNIQNMQYKSGWKKSYSEISQAWQYSVANNLIQQRSTWCDDNINLQNFNALKDYFKVEKDCGLGISTTKGCFAHGGDNFWGIPENISTYSFIDVAGRSWGGASNLCGTIIVDINGFKQPNKFGRDRFAIITETDDSSAFKIHPLHDVIDKDVNECPEGDCYYTKWIME
jgi:prepilin-type N-terminal cleavage/methylation domain-containing protein